MDGRRGGVDGRRGGRGRQMGAEERSRGGVGGANGALQGVVRTEVREGAGGLEEGGPGAPRLGGERRFGTPDRELISDTRRNHDAEEGLDRMIPAAPRGSDELSEQRRREGEGNEPDVISGAKVRVDGERRSRGEGTVEGDGDVVEGDEQRSDEGGKLGREVVTEVGGQTDSDGNRHGSEHGDEALPHEWATQQVKGRHHKLWTGL